MTAPEWLTQRGGALKLGSDQKTWYVIFNDKPLYGLSAVPAGGKHGCSIKQTMNGTRVPCSSVHDTADAALKAGLEDLRATLGW